MKLLIILIFGILFDVISPLSMKNKVKNRSKRCSDYLPPVTYPDMTKTYSIGDPYYQSFVTPVKQMGCNMISVS